MPHLAGYVYDLRVIAPRPLTDPPVPLRKPMAKAARVTLFEREVRERLSQPALEILLDSAEVLSEGQRIDALRASERKDAVFGSTMLTIDLAKVTGRVREACNEDTAQRVAAQIAADERVGMRLKQMAGQVAQRLAGTPVGTLTTDVRVRTRHAVIFIDIDFEAVA